MKTYRYSALLLSFLMLASCEMDFDIKDGDGKDRLLVNCVASTMDDDICLSVLGLRSINKAPQDYRSPSGLQVRFYVDGEERTISPWTGTAPADDYLHNGDRFSAGGGYKPGQNLRVEVSADGFEPACAETSVPVPVEDFSVELVRDGEHYYHVILTYPDNPDTQDMYGAVAMTRVMQEMSTGENYIYESPEYRDIIRYSDDMFDITDFRLVPFRDGADMAIWNDSRKSEAGCQTVRFQIKGIKDYERVTNDYFGEHRSMIRAQYKIFLLKLSPEYFRYLNGQADSGENVLGALGLASPTFTYTNVIGGAGVLGAFSFSETEWMYNMDQGDL